MSRNDPFEVGAVEVLKKTDRALLVKSVEHGELWIPFSQLHDDSEVYETSDEGDLGNLVVTQWLAEERGLC